MSPHRNDLMAPEGLNAVLADLRSFWNELGLKLDTSSLRIPERQNGFNRLLVMPKGATADFLYGACSRLFPCRCYTDNLGAIISGRDPDKLGAYAIWVCDRVEAKEGLERKSANDLVQANIQGITVPERLAFELKYFKETGEHLDVKKATLCMGSWSHNGYVLSVYWRYGELRVVDDYFPANMYDHLHARVAA